MHISRTFASLIATTLAVAGTAHAAAYSPEANNNLRFMIEEEKLAGDLYEIFYTQTGLKPFGNIMKSEDQHYSALVTQAGVAGLDVSDLTSLSKGQFKDPALQSLYSNLLTAGSKSSFAALTVGKNVELKDIADLDISMAEISSSSSLYSTYGNLRNGSNNHLRAFNTWLAVTPAPPVPEPETYAMMLAGLGMIGGIARRRKALPC
jgi:hypothetical protein